MRVLLKISYLGTAYHGWQVQPNGITVQETMQNALERLYKSRPNLTGCSRTDAGVHAIEFFCHYDTDKYIEEKGIVAALNTVLPNDISVLGCKYVDDNFHARYSAKGKNYIYRIFNSTVPSPFEENRSWRIARALDECRMNEFAAQLVGTHDFVGFSSSGRTVTDTVRTITECSVKRENDIITLSITADGFLYNMVRIIVGTAVDMSDNKLNPDDTLKIINSKSREAAGITAVPCGLYLNKVIY
ncbi:MAG: tRNA pseudouridine(38-40) synthase TruA [Clostridia bacterium]|nr:tRNA pseudouridine(38-40) synthase TruA [Clostridia bacterium]